MRRFNTFEEKRISALIHVDDSQVEYFIQGGSYLAYLSGDILTQADNIEDLAEYINEYLEYDEEDEI